jgi:hypothetical protein
MNDLGSTLNPNRFVRDEVDRCASGIRAGGRTYPFWGCQLERVWSILRLVRMTSVTLGVRPGCTIP